MYIINMFSELRQYAKELLIWAIRFIFNHRVTQETWNEAVQSEPFILKYVLDRFKTQNMCNRAVKKNPSMLENVPDQYKT